MDLAFCQGASKIHYINQIVSHFKTQKNVLERGPCSPFEAAREGTLGPCLKLLPLPGIMFLDSCFFFGGLRTGKTWKTPSLFLRMSINYCFFKELILYRLKTRIFWARRQTTSSDSLDSKDCNSFICTKTILLSRKIEKSNQKKQEELQFITRHVHPPLDKVLGSCTPAGRHSSLSSQRSYP